MRGVSPTPVLGEGVPAAEWQALAREQGAHRGWVNGARHCRPGGPNGTVHRRALGAQGRAGAEGRSGAAGAVGAGQGWQAQGQGQQAQSRRREPPPIEVIVTEERGQEPDLYRDPKWHEYIKSMTEPYPYWLGECKGRAAWERKYSPVVGHGEKWRVALKTGAEWEERVSALGSAG